MASVFLSYAREDAARIAPLAAALERVGHRVWWDQHISGGEQFASAIEQALEQADVVIVAWSQASCKSAWVRDEAAAGRDSNRLVPVSLGGCVPPLGFRQYQTIDLSGWNGRGGGRKLAPLLAAVEAKAAASGGTKAPAPVRASATPSTFNPRLLAASLGALVLLGGGLFYATMGSASGALEPRVAIGGFAVVSPDLPPGMAQAISDEIVAAFGAENAVAVTTAAPGKAAAAPFVLDGSVRKEGDALRFTVSLKDSESGLVVWSHGYDRAAADTLAARQVSVASSQVVRCGLWGASSYPKRMPEEALSLYLQFCGDYWSGSADEQKVLDAARKVTVAAPDFSFGWSALALAAVPLAQGDSPDAQAVRKQAIEAAHKSIKLDELNPEGYMALAGLLPMDRFAEREELLKKAISVRPTECGCERESYGDFLASVGRLEHAVEQYERAQALMPLAPFTNVKLAQALFIVGRNEEASKILNQAINMWPDATSLRLLKLKSALWTRDYDDGLAMLDQPGLHLSEAQREALASAFTALKSGDPGLRARASAKLQAITRDPRRIDRLAVAALAALGAHQEAIAAARRLISRRGPMLADVLFEPNLAAASSAPAYAQLVAAVGLDRYWRTSRQAPDICGREAKGGFCLAA
ncbi:MAG TPA: TIR domain-containing protein [Sphingomicrobium sp.]|nr:TIR domain-containing protein [Sphingomicrobium sp.]